jgi:hypothetical protein
LDVVAEVFLYALSLRVVAACHLSFYLPVLEEVVEIFPVCPVANIYRLICF